MSDDDEGGNLVGHSITIPDELWDAYGGSPMRMRDTLWQALVVQSPPTAEAEPLPDRGTWIAAQWATSCTLDRVPIATGSPVVIRTNRVTGVREVLCPPCAERELDRFPGLAPPHNPEQSPIGWDLG